MKNNLQIRLNYFEFTMTETFTDIRRSAVFFFLLKFSVKYFVS